MTELPPSDILDASQPVQHEKNETGGIEFADLVGAIRHVQNWQNRWGSFRDSPILRVAGLLTLFTLSACAMGPEIKVVYAPQTPYPTPEKPTATLTVKLPEPTSTTKNRTPTPRTTPTRTIVPATATATVIPKTRPANIDLVQTPLSQTKAAMEARGLRTSFIPEPPFTQEIYERASKSTVVLKYLTDNGKVSGGTGVFLDAGDPNRFYLATATHGWLTKLPAMIGFYRPEWTNDYQPLTITVMAYDMGRDLTIFSGSTLSIRADHREAIGGVRWNPSPPEIGKPYVTIGSNVIFRPNEKNPFDRLYDALMKGTVVRPKSVLRSEGAYVLHTPGYYADSGSGLFRLDSNGEPQLIALAKFATVGFPAPGEEHWAIGFTLAAFDPLVDAIRKTPSGKPAIYEIRSYDATPQPNGPPVGVGWR